METLHTVLGLLAARRSCCSSWRAWTVIAAAGVRGVARFVRRDPATRLRLARGMALGLEFKLGSEILRTVVVRELQEIVFVGAIILLRAALTLLLHWEIKSEEQTLR